MSVTTFYQTFYQNEQLFRLENDPFVALTSTPASLTESLVVDTKQTQPVDVLPPPPTLAEAQAVLAPVADLPVKELLVDPITEPELVDEQPVILEAAPVKTMPSTHRPSVDRPDSPARPLLNHKVLILVDEELLPSDVLFLEKILNAINLNVNGVDLLNVHGLDGVDFAPILADKVIHHFLTFGVSFQRLNLDILMDRYQPVRFHGITFMMADPLAAIEGDKNLKKRLWEALKRIFLMG